MRGSDEELRRSARNRVLWFLGLALGLHLLAAPPVARLFGVLGQNSQATAETRKVRILPLASRDRLRDGRQRPDAAERERQQTLAEQKRAEEEKKKKEEEKLTGQVVDLPAGPDDAPPEDAKYLSEHNTRTDHETRSRHQAQSYANAMNERTQARRPQAAAPGTPGDASALEIGPNNPQPGKAKSRAKGGALELPDARRRDKLALKMDPKLGRLRNQEESDEMRGNSDRLRLSLGPPSDEGQKGGTAPRQGPPVVNLVPDLGVLARLDGAPSNDHIEGIDEGEGTFLNSREFKYASFFNRLKRGVSQQWDPLSEYRRRDPTGNIYGYRSRVTVVSVTLTADGELKDVSVAQSSGVDFLDTAAVAAFRSAGPFPNPPKGLVDQSGLITFPFGFHVEFRPGGLTLPFD